jgi:hypothetical protein
MLQPKQRAVIVALIGLGLIIVGFFGLRTARAFREFHGHRPPPPFSTQPVETDVDLIRDWMTVPFISKMYRVPKDILFEALEIPEHGNEEKSLKQLNEQYFPQAKDIVMEKVKAALRAAIPEAPLLTPIPPATPILP